MLGASRSFVAWSLRPGLRPGPIRGHQPLNPKPAAEFGLLKKYRDKPLKNIQSMGLAHYFVSNTSTATLSLSKKAKYY